MSALLQDLRFATRLLWKDGSFTATVLLTLGLCIGGNVAIFSVVYSVLLKPLAIPNSDRVLLMYNEYPGATGGGGSGRGATSVPHYIDRLTELDDLFDEQALYQGGGFTIGGADSAEQVFGRNVTPSFFRLVDVPPTHGRIFTEDEGEIGNEQKVILSAALFERLYGGDPAAIDREMRLNSAPYQIVGVMPAGFVLEGGDDVLLWVPLAFTDEQKSVDARHNNSWQMIGRLTPGASLTQAQARLAQMRDAELERDPRLRQALIDARFDIVVTPLQEELVRAIRPTLFLLWGGVLFVLLIGGVNVANLMLIRSNVRLKELGMRHALGAGRGRLARQLLTESVLLSVCGGILGLALGAWGLQLIGMLGAEELPRGGEIAMDGIVLAITLAATTVIGLLLGLAPVVRLTTADLQTTLRQETRSGTTGRGVRTFRNALVVAQVSVAFVLLIGAMLLLASFQRVLAADPGFTADHVLTAQISMPLARYPEPEDWRALTERATRRIRSLPGVVSAGVTTTIPFGNNASNNVIRAVGREQEPGESVVAPNSIVVDTDYFETMEIALVEGRVFDGRDTPDSMSAIIIDDRLARKFWPDQSALGRQLYNDIELSDDATVYTVVGVVAEHSIFGVDGPEPVGAYFYPMSQRPIRGPTFAVRTEQDPHTLINAVRAEVAALDPELPLFFVQTMEERMSERMTPRRTPMLLALGFALIALFLSGLGIYGVLAYRVTQRTREFGIRMALGSSARQLFRLVLSEGAAVLAIGLSVGLAGAVLLRDAVASQLYDVDALDPIILSGVMLLLGLVAFVACALPARRATAIDPVSALNYE